MVDADLLGIASGAAASIAAWTGLRQYRSLAVAYALTAHELRLVRDSLPHAEDEARWAQVVSDAEQAISREHTLWRARRSPVQLDL